MRGPPVHLLTIIPSMQSRGYMMGWHALHSSYNTFEATST